MNQGGKTGKQNFGDWGEQLATNFLVKKGYVIVDRNVRFRIGEIDIIAWNKKPHFGRTLCFIEVKTRSKLMDSGLWVTTQQRKMQSMKTAARLYCIKSGINVEKTPIQFEYVAVKPVPERGVVQVSHKIISI